MKIIFITILYTNFLIAGNFNLNKEACDQGIIKGCFNLGYQYFNGKGVKPNLEKALYYFEESCNKNYIEACGYVASIYMGDKIPNIEKAKKYNVKCCSHNLADGCQRLGLIYKKEGNIEKAKKYLNKACTLKDGDYACHKLGEMYYKGDHVKRNLRMAKKYFKLSCKGSYSLCDEYDDLVEAGF